MRMTKSRNGKAVVKTDAAFYAQVRDVFVQARQFVHKTANFKSKVAKAKRFAAMVESGELIPDEITIKNFNRIFDWLEILDWEGAFDDELEWYDKHHNKV